MILLVSGATTKVREYAHHPHLGRFTQPRCGNNVAEIATCGMPWAADNDALQGVNPDELLTLWNEIAVSSSVPGYRPPLFVAVPDAVEMTPTGPRGDWNGTLWLFRSWLPALKARGLPAAIVGQDGATPDEVPWDDVAAVFIGGSTAWKLGAGAAHIIAAAKARGKWVHVGRVNSFSRLSRVEAMGADSMDGYLFSRAPKHIPRFLDRLAHQQHGAFSVAACSCGAMFDEMHAYDAEERAIVARALTARICPVCSAPLN